MSIQKKSVNETVKLFELMYFLEASSRGMKGRGYRMSMRRVMRASGRFGGGGGKKSLKNISTTNCRQLSALLSCMSLVTLNIFKKFQGELAGEFRGVALIYMTKRFCKAAIKKVNYGVFLSIN